MAQLTQKSVSNVNLLPKDYVFSSVVENPQAHIRASAIILILNYIYINNKNEMVEKTPSSYFRYDFIKVLSIQFSSKDFPKC